MCVCVCGGGGSLLFVCLFLLISCLFVFGEFSCLFLFTSLFYMALTILLLYVCLYVSICMYRSNYPEATPVV